MDLEKRKTIISEIEHWRRSKLLPEQYCDFLLNLYMDESVESSSSLMGISPKSIQNSHWKFWLLAFGLISLIFFVVIHFNSFYPPMQIGIAAAVTLGFFAAGMIYHERKPAVGLPSIGMGSLSLLSFGILFLKKFGWDEPVFITGYVAFCSLTWILFGLAMRIALLQFCGWIGMILFYGWIIHEYADMKGPVYNEFYWVPAALLFGWLCWLLHLKNKRVSAVLLAVAVLLWFMPQIYSLLAEETGRDLIQMTFTAKAAVIALILFLFRKKWTEWVA